MITLATLEQATEQEVFDQVAKHLLTQNERSTEENSSFCMYRNAKGLKCAAGCLISDEEYDPSWDNGSGGTWTMLASKELVPNAHRYLIRNLQTIHDVAEPHMWYEKLREKAEQCNLEFKF